MWTYPVKLSRDEIDEMLRRADKARTTLRRATLELIALGEQLMAARKSTHDNSAK